MQADNVQTIYKNRTLTHNLWHPAQEINTLCTVTSPGSQSALSKSDLQEVRPLFLVNTPRVQTIIPLISGPKCPIQYLTPFQILDPLEKALLINHTGSPLTPFLCQQPPIQAYLNSFSHRKVFPFLFLSLSLCWNSGKSSGADSFAVVNAEQAGFFVAWLGSVYFHRVKTWNNKETEPWW